MSKKIPKRTGLTKDPKVSEPPPRQKPKRVTKQDVETTPAQEWGERIATGKTIARGGKTTGDVPGATEQKH
jgi:hypothetical protein